MSAHRAMRLVRVLACQKALLSSHRQAHHRDLAKDRLQRLLSRTNQKAEKLNLSLKHGSPVGVSCQLVFYAMA